MSNYAIVTYSLRETGSEPRAGLLCNGDVIDVANGLGQPGYASVAGLLGAWDETEPLLDKLAADVAAPRVPVSGVHVLAPVPAPLAIYCIGANYRDHVDNMARARGLPPEPDPRVLGMPPWFFLKSGHCVVGPDADVAMSGDKLDWEPELVAVIGRKARNVSAEAALGCVAGYTIANDLSARDRIFRKNGNPQSPFFFDFVAQKSFDGACPLGPAIVPARLVRDPHALGIKLWVNQTLRIDSSSAQMIYPIGAQIAHLSTFVTLHPGDLVLTGTPAGAGAETDEYLKVGDVTRIEIEGLGTLSTRLV